MLGHSCIRAVVGAQSNTSHPKNQGVAYCFAGFAKWTLWGVEGGSRAATTMVSLEYH